MAAAAELVHKNTQVEANYSFRPEAEIYGRSLRTIRNLGAFMVNVCATEAHLSPEADQARVEFYTSVEEGFGTDLELGGGLEVRDFDTRPISNGKVMAKDLKTPISEMTKAGIMCGTETARHDKRFMPQLIRSEWDHKNALIVDAMAKGETGYNTRIVVSPFPEEAAAQSGNEYWREIGYVPHLKRGFVQLYHAGEEGIISGSLSFDGSNKNRLRALFNTYGVKIPEEESTDNWLQYAITDTLTEVDAKALAMEVADLAADPRYKKSTNTVDVSKQYGELMDKVFNESYIHFCESLARGYQTAETRSLIVQLADKAASFSTRYSTALYRMRANGNTFTDDDSVVLHELLVYSTIEMMRSLHLSSKKEFGLSSIYSASSLIVDRVPFENPAVFQRMLGGFGAEGARNNRSYSACGLSIDPGKGESSSFESPQSAFGGADEKNEHDSDSDQFGPLTFQCRFGHWNRRPRNRLITQCKVKSCKKSVSC